MEHLRFPIGRFEAPQNPTNADIQRWIAVIEQFPSQLEQLLAWATEADLDTPYRPDGWTVRQVVHHCADSHINSFVRFKLAMTEDNPTIKPYEEARWAELNDAKAMPIEPSLQIIKGLHSRWTIFLKSLSANDLQRTFFHPESGKSIPLNTNIALYAWHCQHHLAHIKLVVK